MSHQNTDHPLTVSLPEITREKRELEGCVKNHMDHGLNEKGNRIQEGKIVELEVTTSHVSDPGFMLAVWTHAFNKRRPCVL